MKFELTILGCGSAVPTAQRNAAAQVLNVLERYFLIDCGEGTQQQLRKFKLPYSKINHIFISHLHGDHFFGVIGFISSLSLQGRKNDLHIYADKRLKSIINFQLNTMKTRLGFELVFHDLLKENQLLYEDKTMTVSSFPLKHRNEAPVNAFLFKEKEREKNIKREMIDAYNVPVAYIHKIKKGEDFVTEEGEIILNELLTIPAPTPRSYAYLTDTVFRESFAENIQNIDLLYHEATYGNEFDNLAKQTFHSTAGQAAKMAVLANAKRLILGHFSSRYPDPEILLKQAREIFPNTDVCYDGTVFDVPLEKRKA